MNGTEKQIKWANNIMNDALNTIDANVNRMEKENPQLFRFEIQAYNECKEEMQKLFAECEDAKKIIENRDMFDPRRINLIVQQRASQLKGTGLSTEK